MKRIDLYSHDRLMKDCETNGVGYIVRILCFNIRVSSKNIISHHCKPNFGNKINFPVTKKRIKGTKKRIKRHHKKFWSNKEIKILTRLHNKGEYADDIGKELGRTTGSITGMERRLRLSHKLKK